MARPKLKDGEKKVRVLVTLDKSIYENAKKNGNFSKYVNGLLSMSLACGRLGVRIPLSPYSTSSSPNTQLQLKKFYDVKITDRPEKVHQDRRKDFRKLSRILSKSIYENPPELVQDLRSNHSKLMATRDMGRMTRLLIQYAWEVEFLSNQDKAAMFKEFVPKADHPDNYVPTAEEICATLALLPEQHVPVYIAMLLSGVRLSEMERVIDISMNTNPQQISISGYVKVNLNWKRGRKNAFFAYLPKEAYDALPSEPLRVQAVADWLDKWRHKGRQAVTVKYLRKYFYTRARSIGCPADVVDYIQGRVANTVGAMHYFDLQLQADEWYPRICADVIRSTMPIAKSQPPSP